MENEEPFTRDVNGLLICKKCGSVEFRIHQKAEEYDTRATCAKCGAEDSIHSG